MIFFSFGSMARVIPIRPSVTRLTQRIWTGVKMRVLIISMVMAVRIVRISPALVLIRYLTTFRMFSKITLPSSTALTMLLKLSSVRIMSAVSLVTSVPAIPMAIPTSASFRAGASFAPSPVMATMCPCLLRASTILYLCSGETRAKTATSSITSARASSSISSRSEPARVFDPSEAIPISFAIASAVTLWSPVAIITLIPALWQRAMEVLASGLGGSIIPEKPAKTRSFGPASLKAPISAWSSSR